MFTTPTNVAFLMAAGAGTGILGAILGTGGGVFLIPILLLAFGVPMHFAVATSIITVIATSCAVASVNVERGTANMRLGMTLEIATSIPEFCPAVPIDPSLNRFLRYVCPIQPGWKRRFCGVFVVSPYAACLRRFRCIYQVKMHVSSK
jgi:hypothetical protein